MGDDFTTIESNVMLLFPNQMLARTVSCYSLPADQVLAA